MTTQAVISSTGMFVAIAKNTLNKFQIINFYFIPKIIRILSKGHAP